MGIIKSFEESKKYGKHYVCTLDYDYVTQNLEEILKRYFEKEYALTNFRMKEVWKLYSSDEKWLKMAIGEALLHFYLYTTGNHPAYGKGYEISTAKKIPNSYDAIAFGDNQILFGEAKYVASKSSNIHDMIDDYNKVLKRRNSGDEINIIWTTFDDYDFPITNAEVSGSERKAIFFGVYEDADQCDVNYLENKIDAIEKFDKDLVYEWLFIANSEFEDLAIMVKEFFNE